MRVEVTKNVNENLRQTWQFNMFDLNVVFVGYVVEEKPPRKRKWRGTKKWDRYARKYENSLEEPTLEEHIKREALENAQSMVKVLTWSEWKR
tara:strand:+ start:425 stop:700 length:276 start_codon:yes stop_codon:yes gene_type:complete